MHVDIGASRHPSHLPMVVQIHVCTHPRGTGPYRHTWGCAGGWTGAGGGMSANGPTCIIRITYRSFLLSIPDVCRYVSLFGPNPRRAKRMSGFVQRHGPPSKTDGRFWQGLSATPRPKRVQLLSTGKTDVSFCQPAKPISGFFRRYVPPNKQIYIFSSRNGVARRRCHPLLRLGGRKRAIPRSWVGTISPPSRYLGSCSGP